MSARVTRSSLRKPPSPASTRSRSSLENTNNTPTRASKRSSSATAPPLPPPPSTTSASKRARTESTRSARNKSSESETSTTPVVATSSGRRSSKARAQSTNKTNTVEEPEEQVDDISVVDPGDDDEASNTNDDDQSNQSLASTTEKESVDTNIVNTQTSREIVAETEQPESDNSNNNNENITDTAAELPDLDNQQQQHSLESKTGETIAEIENNTDDSISKIETQQSQPVEDSLSAAAAATAYESTTDSATTPQEATSNLETTFSASTTNSKSSAAIEQSIEGSLEEDIDISPSSSALVVDDENNIAASSTNNEIDGQSENNQHQPEDEPPRSDSVELIDDEVMLVDEQAPSSSFLSSKKSTTAQGEEEMIIDPQSKPALNALASRLGFSNNDNSENNNASTTPKSSTQAVPSLPAGAFLVSASSLNSSFRVVQPNGTAYVHTGGATRILPKEVIHQKSTTNAAAMSSSIQMASAQALALAKAQPAAMGQTIAIIASTDGRMDGLAVVTAGQPVATVASSTPIMVKNSGMRKIAPNVMTNVVASGPYINNKKGNVQKDRISGTITIANGGASETIAGTPIGVNSRGRIEMVPSGGGIGGPSSVHTTPHSLSMATRRLPHIAPKYQRTKSLKVIEDDEDEDVMLVDENSNKAPTPLPPGDPRGLLHLGEDFDWDKLARVPNDSLKTLSKARSNLEVRHNFQAWANYELANVQCRNDAQKRCLLVKLPNDIQSWTAKNVATFLTAVGFPKLAKHFLDEGIDGTALLLLKMEDVVHNFGLKPQAAYKLWATIYRMHQTLDEFVFDFK